METSFLTAPSRCNGHPTGVSESSRHPSPFCSITVPKRGTSIVVLVDTDDCAMFQALGVLGHPLLGKHLHLQKPVLLRRCLPFLDPC